MANTETLTSAATATVLAKNHPATGAPTITGTAQVGQTLTAVTTGIMDDADGLTSPTYMYPVDPGGHRQHRDGHLRGDGEHLQAGCRCNTAFFAIATT